MLDKDLIEQFRNGLTLLGEQNIFIDLAEI